MPMINNAVSIVSIAPLPLRCDTSRPTQVNWTMINAKPIVARATQYLHSPTINPKPIYADILDGFGMVVY